MANPAPSIYDDTPRGRQALIDYCRGRAANDANPMFFGDTLKAIFRLAGQAVPDLADDEVYPYFSAEEVGRLTDLAEERLNGAAAPPRLRLV